MYTRTPFGEIEKQITVVTKQFRSIGRLFTATRFFKHLVAVLLLFCFGGLGNLLAHPMPNSMVILNIHEKHISGEIMIPLGELQSAIGMGVNDNSFRLVERLGDSLRLYLTRHIRPKSFEGKLWTVKLGQMKVVESTDQLVGQYKELVVAFTMAPPLHYDLRNFYFDYDVILHQVASHKALIHVKQDWEQGLVKEDTTTQQVGVIEWDIVNGKLSPFQVSLQQGSAWKGFQNMVSLGISHIVEGTDHVLFLLTLLLPAMLLANGSRWGAFVGIKSSLTNLLKIVTAFTVGHSLTLLLGSLHWLSFPTKPIEVLITFTILVSAFHAFRPIYPQKEVLIAGGFGLIHGLAFAETLTNLELSTKQMVLSILGFNVGIELMQLGIILLVFPGLILLSKTRYYGVFRQIGAVLMMLMALAWMIERIQEKPNFITELIS